MLDSEWSISVRSTPLLLPLCSGWIGWHTPLLLPLCSGWIGWVAQLVPRHISAFCALVQK